MRFLDFPSALGDHVIYIRVDLIVCVAPSPNGGALIYTADGRSHPVRSSAEGAMARIGP